MSRLGLLLLLITGPAVVSAVEIVQANIESESAWTGQAVPLVITLYSPGPFVGTASFDFPDLSKTAFLSSGRPTVGSEELDGESWLTQRHEFTIYTQQAGTVDIPAFTVRFSGKKSFVGEAEPMSGQTSALTFESKRPPGSESLGVVIAVDTLSVEQTWSISDDDKLVAGDVVTRTITQTASGTTAMMLSAPQFDVISGVRQYPRNPKTTDDTQRGNAVAKRTDVVKYQFEQGGTFALPATTIAWWNTSAERLEQTTVPARTINVAAAPGSTETPAAAKPPRAAWAFATSAILAVIGIVYAVGRYLSNRPSNGELIVARQVRTACRANNAAGAYSAVLNWRRVTRFASSAAGFDDAWLDLSRSLYGQVKSNPWRGDQLMMSFEATRRLARQEPQTFMMNEPLAPLNPRFRVFERDDAYEMTVSEQIGRSS